MRLIMKKKVRPKEGDYRGLRRFLYLPKFIGGEWRWLEVAHYRQACIKRLSCAPGGESCFDYLGWIDDEWIENDNTRETLDAN